MAGGVCAGSSDGAEWVRRGELERKQRWRNSAERNAAGDLHVYGCGCGASGRGDGEYPVERGIRAKGQGPRVKKNKRHGVQEMKKGKNRRKRTRVMTSRSM